MMMLARRTMRRKNRYAAFFAVLLMFLMLRGTRHRALFVGANAHGAR